MTERNSAPNSVLSTPSVAPLENEGVRRQLAKLYGESLFGAWPELDEKERTVKRGSRLRIWLKRSALFGAVGLSFWGAMVLFRPGLSRQDNAVRTQYAEELKSFLNDGALPQAAAYVSLVDAQAAEVAGTPSSSNVEHRELIVFAEALLYRYLDADPTRLKRIESSLSNDRSLSPLQRVAKFTLLSREERAARLTEIKALSTELPRNNEVEYLLATAFEFRGNTKEARVAWTRSAQLGPAWFVHRYEQANFELFYGDSVSAKEVAQQIVRVDPESAWAKLASVTFAVSKPSHAIAIRNDSQQAVVIEPVELFYENLQQSLAAARLGQTEKAKELLKGATVAVHQQLPFLFDAFDWLVLSKQPMLAHELVNLPQWPRDSLVAKAKLGRLTALANPSP